MFHVPAHKHVGPNPPAQLPITHGQSSKTYTVKNMETGKPVLRGSQADFDSWFHRNESHGRIAQWLVSKDSPTEKVIFVAARYSRFL